MRAHFATTVALLALAVFVEPSFSQPFRHQMHRPVVPHQRPVVTPTQSFRNPALTPNVMQAQRQIANVQANALRSLYNPYGYNPAAYNPYLYSSAAANYNPYQFSATVNNPYTYNPYAYNPYAYNPSAYNPYLYNPYAYNPQAYNPAAYNPYLYNPYANPAPVWTSPFPY